MRVIFVVGSFPPQACGGEYYTVLLADALKQLGVESRIVGAGKRNLLHTGSLIREVSRFYPDAVHIQYPTMGYRTSLVPHALSMLMPKVPIFTTLHEFSTSHFLRKVSTLPFAVYNRALVFTTKYERRHFVSWYPWVEKKSLIIPIGSNIPLCQNRTERDPLSVVYFGLIRPQKGLEDFLDLAKLSRDAGRPYRFTVLGEPVVRWEPYLEDLKKSANGLPVEWQNGLSAEEVSQALARSRFAYAPLPDGASERRGSLLAALGNGAVVITSQGSQTPKELEEAVRFAATPLQALELLDELRSDTDQADALSSKASEYASRFSWGSISRAHLQLYEQLRYSGPVL